MICCKIVIDYAGSAAEGNISILLTKLAESGDFLWENGSLYFSNTDSPCVDEQYLTRLIRKCGYRRFFVHPYANGSEPKESDRVDAWIYDRLIKIAYQECEKKSQQAFKDIMVGLDMLDAEIERLCETKNSLLVEEEAEPKNEQ